MSAISPMFTLDFIKKKNQEQLDKGVVLTQINGNGETVTSIPQISDEHAHLLITHFSSGEFDKFIDIDFFTLAYVLLSPQKCINFIHRTESIGFCFRMVVASRSWNIHAQGALLEQQLSTIVNSETATVKEKIDAEANFIKEDDKLLIDFKNSIFPERCVLTQANATIFIDIFNEENS